MSEEHALSSSIALVGQKESGMVIAFAFALASLSPYVVVHSCRPYLLANDVHSSTVPSKVNCANSILGM